MDGRDVLQAQLMSKSVGLAAVLTFFFGGFGLLYVTIIGGIIGAIIELVFFVLIVVTGGLGLIIYFPWHLFCVIVAMLMASSHNKRLLRNLDAREVSVNEITGS